MISSANISPLVSVIIPAFNQSMYVSEAINSALEQTYKNIEIIIIDDGSTDETPHILEKYCNYGNIVLLAHPEHQNRGVSKSRQLGVQQAQGKYIAFLDADDFFEPQKVEIQVALLEAHIDAVLCHSHIKLVAECDDTPDIEKWFFKGSETKKYHLLSQSDCLKRNVICNSTTVARAAVLRKLNFDFKQAFQYEDWLLWLLLSEHGHFIYTPEKLLNYRFHPKSVTQKVHKNELLKNYSKIEFYLSLIHRTRRPRIKLLCFKEMFFTMRRLYRLYSIGNQQ